MSTRSVAHSTFVIERTYPVAPARVFAAFADPALKARWFGGSADASNAKLDLDFRIGGHEINRGGPDGGPVYTFEAVYQDIVTNERIVTTYGMLMDETRISFSVATVELIPEDGGTRLIYTEQGAFLDGHDTSEQRESGTRGLLDALGRALSAQNANV
jgi:uncharacterized protein YndB with AHSA1/START domain